MFIDSHCHIDFPEFNAGLSPLLTNMLAAQVDAALCVSVNLENFPRVLAAAESHPNIYASVGVHPDHDEGREPDVDELVALARPCSVTFHRAFDMTVDAKQALEDLIALGVDRVLTTGQESSAVEGLDLIVELVQQAGDRIIVMPGGLRERNIQKFISRTGVKEVHMTARTSVESQMTYRKSHVFMGGALRPPEYGYLTTDPERVATLVKLASEL